MSGLCAHPDQVELRELPASVDGCEECLRHADRKTVDKVLDKLSAHP